MYKETIHLCTCISVPSYRYKISMGIKSAIWGDTCFSEGENSVSPDILTQMTWYCSEINLKHYLWRFSCSAIITLLLNIYEWSSLSAVRQDLQKTQCSM